MKKPNAKLEFTKAKLIKGFKGKYTFDTEDEAKKFYDELKNESLNNKIEWRTPSPQSYDVSKINRIHLDGYGLYE